MLSLPEFTAPLISCHEKILLNSPDLVNPLRFGPQSQVSSFCTSLYPELTFLWTCFRLELNTQKTPDIITLLDVLLAHEFKNHLLDHHLLWSRKVFLSQPQVICVYGIYPCDSVCIHVFLLLVKHVVSLL